MREHHLDILATIVSTRGGFGHREHLELAWSCLDSYGGKEEAHQAVASAIRHIASTHGTPNKYHETITRFWVHLVALHRAQSGAPSFDQFIAENAALLDSRLLGRHYSRELLSSRHARTRPTQPDLLELPGLLRS